MATAILNNYGILESIVGFLGKTNMCLILIDIPSQYTNFFVNICLCTSYAHTSHIILPDCKSMVQLSLGCKQLCSDVNKIALSIVNSSSTEFIRGILNSARDNVFEELNFLRIKLGSKELWVGNKTYKQSLEWLETHVSGMIQVRNGNNGSVRKKKFKVSSKGDGRMRFDLNDELEDL